MLPLFTSKRFILKGMKSLRIFRKSLVSFATCPISVLFFVKINLGELNSSSPTSEPLNSVFHSMERSMFFAAKKSVCLCEVNPFYPGKYYLSGRRHGKAKHVCPLRDHNIPVHLRVSYSHNATEWTAIKA